MTGLNRDELPGFTRGASRSISFESSCHQQQQNTSAFDHLVGEREQFASTSTPSTLAILRLIIDSKRAVQERPASRRYPHQRRMLAFALCSNTAAPCCLATLMAARNDA